MQKNIRIDDKLGKQIKALALQENVSENSVILQALQHYCDFQYMQNYATIINQEFLKLNEGQLKFLEDRINNKTNQVLSSMGIQLSVMTQAMADNLDIHPEDMDRYRKVAVEFLKTNNRIFDLKELL